MSNLPNQPVEPAAQVEVNLDDARESLAELVPSLQLTDTERAALAAEIDEINKTIARVEAGTIHIAAFGMVSRGKSALLNALVGEPVFEVAPTHGTTLERQSVAWQIARRGLVAGGEVSASSGAGDVGAVVELIDTPGINEVDGQQRAALAEAVARRADLLLFVVSGDMLAPELDALAALRAQQKPIILVFNKIDLYPETDRDKVYAKIRDDRVRELLRPEDVVMAAARPKPVKVLHRQPDGRLAESWETPPPDVTAVKLRILDVLEREGRSLLALNTMLYANDVHERIVARKMELREDSADRLIWRFTISKALIVACNPVVAADIAGGLGADIAMVFALSRLYGIPMTRAGVGKLVIEVGKMAGMFTATELGSRVLLGLAKSVFSAGALFTGGAGLAAYAAVAPIQAFAAGYSSRVIGEATKVYLRNGASWGPGGPKRVIEKILAGLDRDSIIARIRAELEQRLRKA